MQYTIGKLLNYFYIPIIIEGANDYLIYKERCPSQNTFLHK